MFSIAGTVNGIALRAKAERKSRSASAPAYGRRQYSLFKVLVADHGPSGCF